MRRAASISAVATVLVALSAGCKGSKAPPSVPLVAPSSSGSAAASAPPRAIVAEPILGGACPSPAPPDDPRAYGECVVKQALFRAKSDASVSVVLASDPAAQGVSVEAPAESYSIVSLGNQTFVVGRDAAGAMYGALDVAERLDDQGAAALPLPAPVQAAPTLAVRGATLLLSLPSEKGGAWFRDPRFWTEYLDMLARARMNFLDLHGLYDLATGSFTNPLPALATSPSSPDVGLPREEREANLRMLAQVVATAAVRGIKVGLMSFRGDLATPGQKEKENGEEREKSVGYTREAALDLLTRVPGLAYLGFRIGDSHRDVPFFDSTYLAAMKDAHGHTSVYTAGWGTSRGALKPVIAAGGPETLVLAKYQGDQLGLPYVVSGGGMEQAKTASYEDLLSPFALPYRFVWEVNASATHRIFRGASYDRTRREVVSMLMSGHVAGFTFEAAHAPLAQKGAYHASEGDSFSPYTFRRDELSYLLFGRLGYDPNTKERIFQKALSARVGTDALWAPLQAASDVAPWIAAAHVCGLEVRDAAPELELGAPVSYLASAPDTDGRALHCGPKHGTLDEFAVALPFEAAADLVSKKGTSRLSPVDVALTLLADAKAARGARSAAISSSNAEARDIVRECGALADLAEWFAHKLRSATALAVYEASDVAPWLEAAKDETRAANLAWNTLVADTSYLAPFDEKTRMQRLGLSPFHWKRELSRLDAELPSINKADADLHKDKSAPPRPKPSLPQPMTWLDAPRRPGPGFTELDIKPDEPNAASWTVTATFGSAVPRGATVRILYRPFRSDGGDWSAVAATGSGASWKGAVPGVKGGAMFAVEVDGGAGQAFRYPDVTKTTPYKAVAP